MKRDLDLIKALLNAMNDSEGFYFSELTVSNDNISDDTVINHLLLMEEAGFITGEFNAGEDGVIYDYSVRPTYQGYEFLSLMNNKSIWEKAKNKFKEKSFDISFDLFKQLLIHYSKEALFS